ncbi:MAG: hypothetical protein ACRDJ1_05880 [Actinomycetota bacterium]
MRSPSRVAAAGMTGAIAVVMLIAGAVSSTAAGPPVESYQATGEARGLDVAFTFQGSIFERLLDLGVPNARSTVGSEGGGSSRSSAAQLFPGDLVIGAAGEQIPGYRQAVYPKEIDADEPDDSHLSDTFRMPGSIGGGPFMIDTGHIVTTASADRASGRATTNVVSLSPLITVKSLDSFSESVRSIDHVEHDARTVVHGIEIAPAEALTIKIGTLVATAHTMSDGAAPAAETSLKLSDVEVVLNGTPYRATIDEEGIRITGLAEDAAVVPGFVPQDVNQALQVILDQANVRIATAQGTKTVEDVAADASLSGLLVTFTGTVPNVFIPDAVSELIYGTIVPQLPENIRKEFIEGSTCYVEDIKPQLPEQLAENLPSLPLCFSPQVIPGPGSGTVTTISLGTVRSLSAAVQSTTITEPDTDGAVDGGFIAGPPFDGGFGPPTDGGIVPQQPVAGGPQGPTLRLTGLVARLPSSALFGAGGAFLLLAMILAMRPSLRGWRAIREP